MNTLLRSVSSHKTNDNNKGNALLILFDRINRMITLSVNTLSGWLSLYIFWVNSTLGELT
jgi:hypothetical protein